MKNKRGYTALELIITVAVSALIVLMSVSIGTSSVKRASFTGAFNKFIADFYYAKQLASRDNRYIAIEFDAVNNSYRILRQKDFNISAGEQVSEMTDHFESYRKILPLDGKQFFTSTSVNDFTISPTGCIRGYPLNLDIEPISVNLEFFEKNESDEVVFKRKILIYPSGGIKVDEQKSGNQK